MNNNSDNNSDNNSKDNFNTISDTFNNYIIDPFKQLLSINNENIILKIFIIFCIIYIITCILNMFRFNISYTL